MDKYPCGVCSIDCKSASVKCDSVCAKWYHGRCVNISNTSLRLMAKSKDKKWICSACNLRHKNDVTKKDMQGSTRNSFQKRNDLHETSLEDDIESPIAELIETISTRDVSESSDLGESLNLAGELGHALLSENNKLKQVIHDLKGELSAQHNQFEDFAKLAQEEIIKITNDKSDLENELSIKISSLNTKVELGIQLNEDLIKLNDRDKDLLHNEIKTLNKEIHDYKIIIKNKNRIINNINGFIPEEESVIVDDLTSELDNKIEIIRVLKDDLDKLTTKHQALISKCEGLQLFINTHHKSLNNSVNNDPEQKEFDIILSNRYSILDEDFPELNTLATPKCRSEQRTTLCTTKPWPNPKHRKLHTEKNECPTDKVVLSENECRVKKVTVKSSERVTSLEGLKPLEPTKMNTSTLIGTKSPPTKITPLVQKSTKSNKILILADSHGRKLSELLQNAVKDEYEISSIFHPNATLAQVTSDISPLVKNFTKKDYVIVIGGTNDLGHNVTKNFDHDLHHITQCTVNTNLIMTNIPLRFDLFTQAKLHRYLNAKFISVSQKCNHINLIDLTGLNRNNFTNHGLHLNYNGKSKLISYLITAINSFKTKGHQYTRTFINHNNQQILN